MINLNKFYNATTYQGASAGFEGRSGFVPKALSGDELKFLRGDGTWQIVQGGGNNSYATTIGDGVLSSFNINHNLNTEDISVQVRDLTTGEVIYPVIDIVSTNTVSIFFNIVPTSNQFRVVVLSHGGVVNPPGAYNTTIGNGLSNTFTVTHSLNTSFVVVQVSDANTGDVVYPNIQINSANSVVLDFDTVPTLNQFNVTVLSVNGNVGGGGGSTTTSTGIHIPAPVLKYRRSGIGQVLPNLYVTYTPTLTSTWLSPQTEVWLFAYRKHKKKKWLGHWSGVEKYQSGYVHPADTTRWAANSGQPLYAGDPGRVYHTEFSFTSAGLIPQPYQQVPLTAFNPLEFYSINSTTQVSLSDFPFAWNVTSYGIYSPRMPGKRGSRQGKNLTTYYEFRFAIPNPDTSSKYPKLFGPPSYLKVRPKFTDIGGNPVPRGSFGSYISFMNYASDNK